MVIIDDNEFEVAKRDYKLLRNMIVKGAAFRMKDLPYS